MSDRLQSFETAAQPTESPIYLLENIIVSSLAPLRLLLVVDNIDGLLADEGEAATDLKFFLGRLFERCNFVKVVVTATEPLSMFNVSGFGVVENCVSLENLTLRNALRLYARLAPSLVTAHAKASFVNALLPLKQMHVNVNSRELSVVAATILAMIGQGHPARVVKLACDSTLASIEQLRAEGERLIAASGGGIGGGKLASPSFSPSGLSAPVLPSPSSSFSPHSLSSSPSSQNAMSPLSPMIFLSSEDDSDALLRK